MRKYRCGNCGEYSCVLCPECPRYWKANRSDRVLIRCTNPTCIETMEGRNPGCMTHPDSMHYYLVPDTKYRDTIDEDLVWSDDEGWVTANG